MSDGNFCTWLRNKLELHSGVWQDCILCEHAINIQTKYLIQCSNMNRVTEQRVSFTFLMSSRQEISGERPPCTHRNCWFSRAASGRQSKASMQESYTRSEYLILPVGRGPLLGYTDIFQPSPTSHKYTMLPAQNLSTTPIGLNGKSHAHAGCSQETPAGVPEVRMHH